MRVPVLIPPPQSLALWGKVRNSLANEDLELEPLEDWDEVRPEDDSVVVVLFPESSGPSFLRSAREFSHLHPSIALIFVTASDLTSLEMLSAGGLHSVLLVPELHRLGAEIRLGQLRVDLARVRQMIVSLDYPMPVGAAVRLLVRRIQSLEEPLPQTQDDLAQAVGCSSSTLRRKARAHGINLWSAMRHATLVRAMWIREAEGLSWSQVAVRLGYDGISGLSELSRQVSGVGVRELRSSAWQRVTAGLGDALRPES